MAIVRNKEHLLSRTLGWFKSRGQADTEDSSSSKDRYSKRRDGSKLRKCHRLTVADDGKALHKVITARPRTRNKSCVPNIGFDCHRDGNVCQLMYADCEESTRTLRFRVQTFKL